MNKTVDHWIGVADTLKQQRDQAEKERDALREDADIVRRARARSSVVVEVTPELLTKNAFTAQPLHVMLTDNGDGTHLLTFRESEELHTLRTDAARLDWLAAAHTLHNSVEILYVVDGYTVDVMHHDGATCHKSSHAETLREAIDAAMEATP
jgi:hypothetical protein